MDETAKFDRIDDMRCGRCTSDLRDEFEVSRSSLEEIVTTWSILKRPETGVHDTVCFLDTGKQLEKGV